MAYAVAIDSVVTPPRNKIATKKLVTCPRNIYTATVLCEGKKS
jgi:hypothetical protein